MISTLIDSMVDVVSPATHSVQVYEYITGSEKRNGIPQKIDWDMLK
jgi:hypothetical protein